MIVDRYHLHKTVAIHDHHLGSLEADMGAFRAGVRLRGAGAAMRLPGEGRKG
jgi:hypothetical protein